MRYRFFFSLALWALCIYSIGNEFKNALAQITSGKKVLCTKGVIARHARKHRKKGFSLGFPKTFINLKYLSRNREVSAESKVQFYTTRPTLTLREIRLNTVNSLCYVDSLMLQHSNALFAGRTKKVMESARDYYDALGLFIIVEHDTPNCTPISGKSMAFEVSEIVQAGAFLTVFGRYRIFNNEIASTGDISVNRANRNTGRVQKSGSSNQYKFDREMVRWTASNSFNYDPVMNRRKQEIPLSQISNVIVTCADCFAGLDFNYRIISPLDSDSATALQFQLDFMAELTFNFTPIESTTKSPFLKELIRVPIIGFEVPGLLTVGIFAVAKLGLEITMSRESYMEIGNTVIGSLEGYIGNIKDPLTTTGAAFYFYPDLGRFRTGKELDIRVEPRLMMGPQLAVKLFIFKITVDLTAGVGLPFTCQTAIGKGGVGLAFLIEIHAEFLIFSTTAEIFRHEIPDIVQFSCKLAEKKSLEESEDFLAKLK